MTRMWIYTLAVLVLWVINPELRRLYDWRFGFSQVEILSILPLIALGPHLWSLTMGGGWRRLPRVLVIAAFVWVSGFTYALFIAAISGNIVAGTYSFVIYVFPLALGLWVSADQVSFAVKYRRVTRVLFAFTTFASVYGIIQYVLAPPWDVLWLQSSIDSGLLGFGQPEPFKIRVFSTLNDPGTFACFVALMLLLALPEYTPRKIGLLLQLPLWLVAFFLTSVRTGWLMFAIGAITYLVLAPRRVTLISTIGLIACLVAGVAAVLPAAVGNDGLVSSIQSRFATLGDLDDDMSSKVRQDEYAAGPDRILQAPLGYGLGVIGTATKLGASGSTTVLDSGILSRFIEMGIPGALMYLSSLLVLAFASFQVWFRSSLIRDKFSQSVAAMAIGSELAFFFLLLAGDANGVLLLSLWVSICVVTTAHASQPAAEKVQYA
jgi:putative inorganic carbon (HCO3(-)) transporter